MKKSGGSQEPSASELISKLSPDSETGAGKPSAEYAYYLTAIAGTFFSVC